MSASIKSANQTRGSQVPNADLKSAQKSAGGKAKKGK